MELDELAIDLVAGLLEERTGQRLTEERRWRIGPALTSLFRDNGINCNQDLIVLLTQPENSSLSQQVVEALLNNETYFFRDRQVFEYLNQSVLPELARKRAAEKRLAIWSIGSSSGQEPLSLAMLFAEQPARWRGWDIEILGTDVSHSIVDFARAATYSNFQIQRGLGVSQMLAHFSEADNGWQANASLRNMVRYEVHNALHPAPYPGRFDLILCRNVLLYFDQPVRERVFSRIHDALAKDGRMVLGGGETVLGPSKHFVPDEERQAVYRPGPAKGEAGHARAA